MLVQHARDPGGLVKDYLNCQSKFFDMEIFTEEMVRVCG